MRFCETNPNYFTQKTCVKSLWRRCIERKNERLQMGSFGRNAPPSHYPVGLETTRGGLPAGVLAGHGPSRLARATAKACSTQKCQSHQSQRRGFRNNLIAEGQDG